MAIIVDGKKIAQKIQNRVSADIKQYSLKPVLAVVLVGDDKASLTYVGKKQEAAEAAGIKFLLYKFSGNISTDKLVLEILKIQKAFLSGIIVQLPLPATIDKKQVLNQLNPAIDVDFLSWVSLGKLMVGDTDILPPAPAAVLEILKEYKVSLKGKHVVIVGQGDLIGKPLTNILVKLPITLTTCNKETKDLVSHTRQADILVTGVGKKDLIRGSMIKKGAVVIDAGTVFYKGRMMGDINLMEVSKKASLVTPTPGGVGPITVAKLLENTVAIAKANKKLIKN